MREKAHAPRFRFRVSFAGVVATAIIVPIVIAALLVPRKAEARPPPFHSGNGFFAYTSLSDVPGENGEKTTFHIREAGFTADLPFRISMMGIGFKPTVIGLWGKAESGIKPINGMRFGKLGGTFSGGVGNKKAGTLNVSIGVKQTFAWTPDWELVVGPPGHQMTIPIPGEYLEDYDFGVEGAWRQGEKSLLIANSLKGSVTEFRARGEAGDTYKLYKGSVGLPYKFGVESQFETAGDGNLSVGGRRSFSHKMGWVSAGGGYEFGTGAPYVEVVGMYGSFLGVAAIRSEEGRESYHLVINYDLSGVVNSLLGKESAPQHGH